MRPDTSGAPGYFGRPVLKVPVWEENVAHYIFLGGLAAGCSLLGAGAHATGRPVLCRRTRLGALGALGLGTVFLVRDLGRPERFHHMLRVAKPTSPMSVGSWLLASYGPLVAVAAAAEMVPRRLRRLASRAARPAGLGAAALAPFVASYTAVLLADTAVPAWNAARRELPFIFTASAAASAGGLGMLVAPVAEAAPARRLARIGALTELVASHRLETTPTTELDTFRGGEARQDLERAKVLTALGVLVSTLLGRRSRPASVVGGLALLAGGFFERRGIFRAGLASAAVASIGGSRPVHAGAAPGS